MKKVLFVATVDSHILQFHLPFLKLFKEKGYEVHVATNGNGKISYCDKKYVISFERSPYKINNLKAIKQLKKVINEEKYDIIHCHTPMGSVVTRLAAKTARKKYHTRIIYTAHGFHFYKGASLLNWLLFYPVEKYLAKYTDTLITINKEDYELAKKKFSKRCRNIRYVPGVGIDEKKFNFEMTDKEKHELRASLGLKDDDFVIIYPARLDKNKNQIFLIDVMKYVLQELDNIHLLLPGVDELNGFYQSKVNEMKISNNIHFLGMRNDIPQLLKISDCAVASSIREGLGLNLVEAMASNLPIIATKNRGHCDLIKNNINGYLIEQNDKIGFAKALIEIANDDTKRSCFINNGKNVVKKFMLDSILYDMNNIYFSNEVYSNRVLQIFSTMYHGGAENFIMNIYRSIDRNKVQFDFLLHGPGVYDDEIRKLGGNVYYLNGYVTQLGVKEYKKELNDFFSNHRYSLIHSHVDKTSGLIISQIKKIYNPICISHSHCCREYNNIIIRLYKKYLKFLLNKNADYKIACSNDAGKWLFNKDYHVINNPINIDKFKYNPNERKLLRNKYGISDNTFVIGTVGRLEKVKNHEFLINLYRKYLNDNDNCKLFILGSGTLKDKLLNMVNEYGLNDRVIMQDAVNDVYRYYNIFDLFAMTSYSEGLGIVLLEATANSLPIISSSCLPKNIAANTNITLIEDFDINKWIKALNNMSKKRIENREFLKQYDVKYVVKEIEELYLNFLNRKGE